MRSAARNVEEPGFGPAFRCPLLLGADIGFPPPNDVWVGWCFKAIELGFLGIDQAVIGLAAHQRLDVVARRVFGVARDPPVDYEDNLTAASRPVVSDRGGPLRPEWPHLATRRR